MKKTTRQEVDSWLKNGQTPTFKPGDIIFHKPTGETWVVAVVEGENVWYMGWPEGYAKAEDCILKEPASAERSKACLLDLASHERTDDQRVRIAKSQVEALKITKAIECKTCQYHNSHRTVGSDSWDVCFAWYCDHPDAPKDDLRRRGRGKYVGEENNEGDPSTPGWCPYKKK